MPVLTLGRRVTQAQAEAIVRKHGFQLPATGSCVVVKKSAPKRANAKNAAKGWRVSGATTIALCRDDRGYQLMFNNVRRRRKRR